MTSSEQIPAAEELRRRQPTVGKIRIGWLSTWNSKCGIAEYSRFLLDHFDPMRFEWTLLASLKDLCLGPDEDRVIRCWTDSDGFVGPLLQVVERESFDVLVIQFKIQVDFGWLSWTHLEAVIACCRLLGTKVLMILHSTEGADPAGKMASLARIKSALATVDRILVHSTKDIEHLSAFGVHGKVQLFPHGYLEGAPHDRRVVREARGLPEDALIIGSYGFLLPGKGIDKLIEALALLRAAGTRAKLLLVNALYPLPVSPQHLAVCERIAAEQGVRDDVIFETGFLPNEVSLELLAACDVIVFPYGATGESASGAVRMGLAARRPVLCSPQPIFADVSDSVAFLDGGSPPDIAYGIRTLLSDSEGLARLADRRNERLARHSWRRVAELLQDLVEECAAKGPVLRRSQATPQFVATLVAEREMTEAAVRKELAEARAKMRELDQWRRIAEMRYLELQSIFNSRSWRLTKPLRLVGELRGRHGSLAAALRTLSRRKRPAPAISGDGPSILSRREQRILRDLKQAQAQRRQR